MKRRHLLSCATLGTATTVLTACQTQISTIVGEDPNNPKLEWPMATSWTTEEDPHYQAAQYLAEQVSALTDQRFILKPVVAGELAPVLGVLDAVEAGTVPCGHSAALYYSQKNPVFRLGTGLPFGLNARQQAAWLAAGKGLEAMQRLYADFNLVAFPAGIQGGQMGGWFKREVNTLKDLQGLKMRLPGLGGEILQRLGVVLQDLEEKDLRTALDRQGLEAAAGGSPALDERLGLHKVAPFYYYPGWWEPSFSVDLMINRTAWNQLSAHYQHILQIAAAATQADSLAQDDRRNGEALSRLVQQGTQLKPFSLEILEACQQETQAFFAEQTIADAQFKAIYAEWQSFQQRMNRWDQVSGFTDKMKATY